MESDPFDSDDSIRDSDFIPKSYGKAMGNNEFYSEYLSSFSSDDINISTVPSTSFSKRSTYKRNAKNDTQSKISKKLRREIENIESDSDTVTYQQSGDKSNECVMSNENAVRTSSGNPNKLKPSRKRKTNPNNRKQNIRRSKRQHGEEYISSKGTLIKAKTMKPPCSSKCILNCSKNFPEGLRKVIFETFWSLDDSHKSSFYGKFITKKIVKRQKSHSKRKKFTFMYYFEKDDIRVKVCKTFFLNTLAISDSRVYYHFKNHSDEKTGIVKALRHGKHKKHSLAEDVFQKIVEFIKKFPAVDSHYCRASTSKQYLEQGLSISHIYRLFQAEFPSEKVSLCTFTKIFNSEFNLSFYRPRKDQCDRCCLYTNLKNGNRLTNDEEGLYKKHIEENRSCKLERDKDRQLVSGNTVVVCFDLKSTFNLPKGFSSVFYYKRKLSVFNMTATVCSQSKSSKNVTYCAIWNEAHSGRSGNDIAISVIKILENILQDFNKVEHIILWSDSCVPQNKNKILSSALLNILHKTNNLKTITQKFSEPDHSQIQEIDAVHSAIDRFLKFKEIHSPLDLITKLKSYHSKKHILKVIEMTPNDFKVYSNIAGQLNFQTVPFSKIKLLKYNKFDLFSLKYKKSLSEIEFHSSSLKKQARKGVLPNYETIFENQLSTCAKISISNDKKKDIEILYVYLPENEVKFYDDLFK